jgi:hypothetical protein
MMIDVKHRTSATAIPRASTPPEHQRGSGGVQRLIPTPEDIVMSLKATTPLPSHANTSQ